MIYCKIDAGTVTNRAVFEGEMPEQWVGPADVWVQNDTAQIGWLYDGETFIAPPAEPEPPAPIPTSVSARQFKLQLLAAGLLDQVEAFIASQGKAVQIAYDNSGSFVRSEPMMQSGFAALGFTAPQIDAFFTAAAKL